MGLSQVEFHKYNFICGFPFFTKRLIVLHLQHQHLIADLAIACLVYVHIYMCIN